VRDREERERERGSRREWERIKTENQEDRVSACVYEWKRWESPLCYRTGRYEHTDAAIYASTVYIYKAVERSSWWRHLLLGRLDVLWPQAGSKLGGGAAMWRHVKVGGNTWERPKWRVLGGGRMHTTGPTWKLYIYTESRIHSISKYNSSIIATEHHANVDSIIMRLFLFILLLYLRQTFL
jgi:hypothetical protein